MISGQIALHSAQLSLHVLFERGVKIIRFLAQKFNLRLSCQLGSDKVSLSQRLRSFSFWQHKFRPTISTAKLIKRFFSVCDHCVTRWREQRCLLTTAVNLSVRERHNCHLWQKTILPFWSDGTIKVEIIMGHKFYRKQTQKSIGAQERDCISIC